jgi:hypothetical protein
LWYPFIRVAIDPEVTTVVGANESGKTHLLDAIEKGLTGTEIQRDDFCRYSHFFTVEEGQFRLPDFGFEWTDLNEYEKGLIRQAFGIAEAATFSSIHIFRLDGEAEKAYLRKDDGYQEYPVVNREYLNRFVPKPYRIKADRKLPASVPLRLLTGEESSVEARLTRKQRFELGEQLDRLSGRADWFATEQEVRSHAAAITGLVSGLLSSIESDRRQDSIADFAIAQDLIFKVAKIDKAAFRDLEAAIRDGREGHVNALIARINLSLERSLNLPVWWTQDKDLKLTVSPREQDLVFTVRDRTGSEYSFIERSSGLQVFLSYFIQYKAYESPASGNHILLMDEPDTFLSGQAQQDLLRVMQAFASPVIHSRKPIQVIYVTHSPFLIDKNRAGRIRVLEKGVDDEGTRVVRDAARNHYEPLRSSIGTFVAETTFIGNCNIMVEGIADQVLIAGASRYLRLKGVSEFEMLDLNTVTIVPAGSASQIPYLVYLSTGRDVVRPAIVVLLDADESGQKAYKGLIKGGAKEKQLLKREYILTLDKVGVLLTPRRPVVEIEDLIPPPILVASLERYCREFGEASSSVLSEITLHRLNSKKTAQNSWYDASEELLLSLSTPFTLDKAGLARSVVDEVLEWAWDTHRDNHKDAALQEFSSNFTVLFTRLVAMQQAAVFEINSERISRKLKRTRDSFIADHPDGARRDEAKRLLNEMELSLDDRSESNAARGAIVNLRSTYKLDRDLTERVANYEQFKLDLIHISYAGTIQSQQRDTQLSTTLIRESPEDIGLTTTETLVVPAVIEASSGE